MKSEVKIVLRKDLDFEKVRYYTLKFDGDIHELQKFYNTYQEEYSESIYYIKMWLGLIGEKFSAESRYFRTEDNVGALPPKTEIIRTIDNEIKTGSNRMLLRLYCIVLSPQIVILVNGGIKKSQALRDSPECWKQQQFASSVAAQIHRMIKQGELQIKGKLLKRTKSFALFYKK